MQFRCHQQAYKSRPAQNIRSGATPNSLKNSNDRRCAINTQIPVVFKHFVANWSVICVTFNHKLKFWFIIDNFSNFSKHFFCSWVILLVPELNTILSEIEINTTPFSTLISISLSLISTRAFQGC